MRGYPSSGAPGHMPLFLTYGGIGLTSELIYFGISVRHHSAPGDAVIDIGR